MQVPAADFEQIISKPRIDSYRGYWKVSSDAAVSMYMWNTEVCSEMGKLLAYFEICLRNAIHRELSLNVTAANPSGAVSSYAWWGPLNSQLNSTAQWLIAKEIQGAASPPTPDEVVSRLSFGFWPNMVSWIGKTRTSLLRGIFPSHPLSAPGASPSWSNKAARRKALDEIFEVKDARNRVAHHEPLWKFAAVKDTSTTPATVIAAASTDEASTVVRFQRLLRIYDDAIHAMSPVLANHLTKSSARNRLNFLISAEGRKRYMDSCHLPLDQAMSTIAMHQQLAMLVQTNRPVRITGAGGMGTFFPNH